MKLGNATTTTPPAETARPAADRTAGQELRRDFANQEHWRSDDAAPVVERLLDVSRRMGASDLHLQPTADGLQIRWRIDGVLHEVATLPASIAPNVIARLKVLADLLTYQTDSPQEGRIRVPGAAVEMRLSVFPTLYGEKAVVRLFAAADRLLRLDQLGLPTDLAGDLRRMLTHTAGAILVTGPSGSGKTTTLYACLREILNGSAGQRSVVTLEDPIEVAVTGASQSQVSTAAGFDLASGLRFLLRQDPEVIMVGEIRDPATAEVAFQASLTGHLVLSAFHAGSAAGAIGRLSDMGVEPYVLRSGVLCILSQRLLRRLCQCAEPSGREEDLLGLPVRQSRQPRGCPECDGAGYRGRALVVEILLTEASDLGRAILSRRDAATLERHALQAGMVPLWRQACNLVEAGVTSAAEVRRVLGTGKFGDGSP